MSGLGNDRGGSVTPIPLCNLGLEHFYLRTSSAEPLASINDISEDCSVPSGLAKGLRPLTHGTLRETHIPQTTETQPVEEVKEESSQNGSDSEDSSSSQSSSTTEVEDIESDLESLEEHYNSDLRRYTANLERAFGEEEQDDQEYDYEYEEEDQGEDHPEPEADPSAGGSVKQNELIVSMKSICLRN